MITSQKGHARRCDVAGAHGREKQGRGAAAARKTVQEEAALVSRVSLSTSRVGVRRRHATTSCAVYSVL